MEENHLRHKLGITVYTFSGMDAFSPEGKGAEAQVVPIITSMVATILGRLSQQNAPSVGLECIRNFQIKMSLIARYCRPRLQRYPYTLRHHCLGACPHAPHPHSHQLLNCTHTLVISARSSFVFEQIFIHNCFLNGKGHFSSWISHVLHCTRCTVHVSETQSSQILIC